VIVDICDAAIDNFYRPKLARAIQCSIEKIVIRLGPSLEMFEEELSLSVQNEYRQQQVAPAGGSAQVIKRYMRVLLLLFLKFHFTSIFCLVKNNCKVKLVNSV